MAHYNLQIFADGHLNFDTKLDAKGFTDGIKGLGSIAKGGFAVLGASVAGVTALFAGMSKAALSSVASLEQNVGGVETLFKGSAQTVIDNANKAYKTAGLSANEYMSGVTSFSASLLQSVAGDTEEAARVADMAMVDMSDNANKMGTDMSSIQNAYQGFAKQNYTMLDNLKLGYGGTKEEMQRLLTDASKMSGVEYDISNLNDVYQAIHVIQGELDITGTTAKEASTTIEGSMNAAKAAYDNFLNGSGSADELADAIATAVGNVAENLGEIIPRLAETVPKVLEALGEEFAGGADQFIQMGTGLIANIAMGIIEELPTAIDSAVSFIDTIIQTLSNNMPQLMESGGQIIMSLGSALVSLAGQLIPVAGTVISTFVQGLISGMPSIAEGAKTAISQFGNGLSMALPQIISLGADLIKSLAEGIGTVLPELIPVAVNAVVLLANGLISNIGTIIDAGIALLMGLVDGIINSIPILIEQAPAMIISLCNAFVENLPKIIQAGIELIVKLIAGIVQAIPTLIENLPAIFEAIVTAFKTFDLMSLGKNIILGIKDGVLNAASFLIDAVKDAAQKSLDSLKTFLGIHSPSRVMRDEVGKNIALGIAEGITQNAEYAKKSAEEIASAVLQSAKEKLENHKVYNKLSLADEVAYWNSVRDQVQEGTQARIDADKEYLSAKESLDNQLLKLDQDYADKTAATYKDLNERISSLNQQYQDAVSSRADQISSSFGLFDEFNSSTDLTSDDLLNNLQGQVDGLREWKNNLRDLEHKGIDNELLEELQDLGPSAAAQIQLMTDMSEDELDEYVHLFKEKNRIARKQAVAEMEPMREEISGQISQMQRETAAELAKYQQEYLSSMSELGVALNQPLETMKLTASRNAVALVTTMADTLKAASATTENTDKFKEIASNVIGATNALPASMTTVGQNAITAMIDGIKSMSGGLHEAVTLLIENSVNGAISTALSKGIIEEAVSGIDMATSSVTMTAQTYGNDGYGPGYEMNYKRFGEEVSGAINGMSVVMDGKKVGTVVAEPVNTALGNQGQVKGRDGQ